jgi:uncharacterized phage protein gp47/JayE
MRTLQEIASNLIKNFIGYSEGEVTYVGDKGSAAGYLGAVALEVSELESNLVQAQRDLFVDTCTGAKLVRYVTQRGLQNVPLPASNAGVLLIFSGPINTLIPSGTVIKNKLNGLNYVLQQDVTIGSKNSNLAIDGIVNIKSEVLADTGWAVCAVPGVVGRCPSNTCTVINISGVSVTNPSPAQGGSDLETDEEIIYRYKNENKKANHNTRKFYENLVLEKSDKVLKAIAKKDFTQPDTVKITVATKSGAPLTQGELDILSAQIQENNRAYENVTCTNVNFTYISVTFNVIMNGTDFQRYYNDTMQALSNYLQWRNWDWGQSVSIDDLFVICQKVPQVRDIPLESFKVNGSNSTNILIPNTSLPYMVGLTITNITNLAGAYTKSNSDIVQNYKNTK